MSPPTARVSDSILRQDVRTDLEIKLVSTSHRSVLESLDNTHV